MVFAGTPVKAVVGVRRRRGTTFEHGSATGNDHATAEVDEAKETAETEAS